MTQKVSVKNQVTIPKHVGEQLGIEPGSELEFELGKQGEVLLRKVEPALNGALSQGRFARIRGIATVNLSTDGILALTRGED